MNLLLRRLWDDKYFVSICLFVAICLYSLTSIAWSVFPGRDFTTYIGYFIGFFEADTPYKTLMTIRTFLSSFLIALGASNVFLLTIFLFCYFVVSLLLFYCIGLYISIGHARTFLLVMSLNVPIMIFFHEFSSDLILFMFLVPYVVVFFLAAHYLKARVFFILGFLTFCLMVIRPSNQLFLVLVLLPFLKFGIDYRSVRLAGIFLIAFIVPTLGYSLHNYVRYDTFAVARQGSMVVAYRVFTQDKIIDRNNGPASESLAIAIEEHLLPKEVYKRYNVSVDDIFSSGNKRMYSDLISLSDDVFGWEVNYKPLRDAALEGIWRNPGRFLEVSVLNLLSGYIRGYPSDRQQIRVYPFENAGKRVVEVPHDALSISEGGEETQNQQSFDERFKNFRSYRHFLYSNTTAKDKPWNQIDKTFGESSLFQSWHEKEFFPKETIRNGSSKLGYVLRLMADKFPPIAFFILCTLPIFFRLHQYKYRVLSLIFIAVFLNTSGPIVLAASLIAYRVPYDFVFIFLGIVGLFSSDKLLRLMSRVLPLRGN